MRSFQDYKFEGKIVEVVGVRSFQDDKFEGKIVEVDYDTPKVPSRGQFL